MEIVGHSAIEMTIHVCGPTRRYGMSPQQRGRSAAATPLNCLDRRAPEGIRTPNLLIRSQMLYPLSYGRSVYL